MYLHAEGLAVPVLFACLLGFRLECVMVDVLHTVDQGVASHIVGSVIWLVAVVQNFFRKHHSSRKNKTSNEIYARMVQRPQSVISRFRENNS